VNLTAAPHCLAAIAQWQHQQWLQTRAPEQGDLFSAPVRAEPQALGERQAQLRQHLAARLIPATFVMLEKRAPVGSVSLVEYRSSADDQMSVWLTNMFVLPEHRCQGLAQALLQRAEDYAITLQLGKIFLYAQGAEAFYRKRGWLKLKAVQLDGRKLNVLVRHLMGSGSV
jgi:GNAT superfamily N-acetyltransferase